MARFDDDRNVRCDTRRGFQSQTEGHRRSFDPESLDDSRRTERRHDELNDWVLPEDE